MERDRLVASCSDPGGRLHPETAFAIADLLAVHADLLDEAGRPSAVEARRRALWLYEAASGDPEAAVPLDLHERMDRLARAIPRGDRQPKDI
jgi:hypothetical protein